jgi:hypothetical protein
MLTFLSPGVRSEARDRRPELSRFAASGVLEPYALRLAGNNDRMV